jgi:curved DNA-binding protein CbpA
MEVLGLSADMVIVHTDVQARFRRLARLAHPDHGASPDGAAERLAELSEARELLLRADFVGSAAEERAG